MCGVFCNYFISIGEIDVFFGFVENFNYGFGFNCMSGGKKNLLIFGSFFVIFLFFLSFYGMG